MIEINVGIGQQNGTDCYEVKSVNINPYKIKSEFANTIIDGKAFNNLADLKKSYTTNSEQYFSKYNISFSDENI